MRVRGTTRQKAIDNAKQSLKQATLPNTNLGVLSALLSNDEFQTGTYTINSFPDIIKSKEFQDNVKVFERADHNGTLLNWLASNGATIMEDGFRPGEGVNPDLYPTALDIENFINARDMLSQLPMPETPYSRYLKGEISYPTYISQLRDDLANRGGGLVSIFRDLLQSGFDSQSATLVEFSKENAVKLGALYGVVGYEQGGAQYQKALMDKFNPLVILAKGLPLNMPSHSLQRNLFGNGLEKLSVDGLMIYYNYIQSMVSDRYGTEVPWEPYNFHHGNTLTPSLESTRVMLENKMKPMPTWVFSPKFPEGYLSNWVREMIDLFTQYDEPMDKIRIKNPGQRKDFTVETVMGAIRDIKSVFDQRSLLMPIVYLHTHDINGLAGHVCKDVLRECQKEEILLVVDADVRKNGTHPENEVVADALTLSSEAKEALALFNENQNNALSLLKRFDSRSLQGVSPFDPWPGGTGASDVSSATQLGLSLKDAKRGQSIAYTLLPLERPVTPASEFLHRIGLAVMKEPAITEKTPEEVVNYYKSGNRLNLADTVVKGIYDWETGVEKPEFWTDFVRNHQDQINDIISKKQQETSCDLGSFNNFSQEDVLRTAFGASSTSFLDALRVNRDLSPLLNAPEIIHRRPGTLDPGSSFTLTRSDRSSVTCKYRGRTESPTEIFHSFDLLGEVVNSSVAKKTGAGEASLQSNEKADSANPHHVGMLYSGQLVEVYVTEGQSVQKGANLFRVYSMKMETSVQATTDGVVKRVVVSPENGPQQLEENDLVVELKPD